MDYEKLYKEVLERARQFSKKPYLEDSKDIVEYIFPELKESEDERIRKQLVNIVAFIPEANFTSASRENCRSWLEKQGEQKSAWGEEDEIFLYKIHDHIREFYVDKKGYPYVAEPDSPEMKEFNWLESLKDRIQHPRQSGIIIKEGR